MKNQNHESVEVMDRQAIANVYVVYIVPSPNKIYDD